MIAFVVLALVAVVAALLVVGTRNPVVSALWLALTFVAVAGVFVVLGAEFLAAIQLIVYAGAILVFFLFVIMLLNLGQLPPGDIRQVQQGLGLYLAIVLAVVLGFAIHATIDRPAPGSEAAVGNTEALATVLYSKYVFPFEVTSVLLTVAVVGAVVLAKKSPKEKS